MMTTELALCNVCYQRDKEFSVPWDSIGIALMRTHFEDEHPEMLPVISTRQSLGADR